MILALFLVIVGFYALAKVRIVSLSCDRVQGKCCLRASGFFGTYQAFPCDCLSHARVKQHFAASEIPVFMGATFLTPTYQVFLFIHQEAISLTPFRFTNRQKAQLAVSQINGFVQNPQERFLSIKESNLWSAFLFGGSCILMASLQFVLNYTSN